MCLGQGFCTEGLGFRDRVFGTAGVGPRDWVFGLQGFRDWGVGTEGWGLGFRV